MTQPFTYQAIPLEELTATDLQREVAMNIPELERMEAYRISIGDHAEAAQALYCPLIQRLGITWGGDATWASVADVESGIDMYINDGEQWYARN